MAVVRCVRCNRLVDMDYDVEVYTNDEIPGLTARDFDYVCFGCLTDDEFEKLK